jgi:hypothetical protein
MANRAMIAKFERAERQRREFGRIDGAKSFYTAHSDAKDVPWYGGAERYIPIVRFGTAAAATADGVHASYEAHRGIGSVGKNKRTTPALKRPVVKLVDGWTPKRKRYSGRGKQGACANAAWVDGGVTLIQRGR